MKSRVGIIAGFALAAAGVLAVSAGMSYASGKDQTITRGDVMVGVSPPYTGATNPIRGINGGGAPWEIGDAEFRLRASGRVDVEFEGSRHRAIRWTAQWGHQSGCEHEDHGQLPVDRCRPELPNTVNVSSETFPVDRAGDAEGQSARRPPEPMHRTDRLRCQRQRGRRVVRGQRSLNFFPSRLERP